MTVARGNTPEAKRPAEGLPQAPVDEPPRTEGRGRDTPERRRPTQESMTTERLVELIRMVDKAHDWAVVMYHLRITPEESKEFARELLRMSSHVSLGEKRYSGGH